MSEEVALSQGGGGRDVSFEREMSSKAPLWWDPSLVPPVSSLVSSGLLLGGGLPSEVGFLAVSSPPCWG